jgi:hypothetical protein
MARIFIFGKPLDGLIAVQLDGIQRTFRYHILDLLRTRINENTNPTTVTLGDHRQPLGYPRRNVTLAPGIEIQSYRIDLQPDRFEDILLPSKPAKLQPR